MKEFDEFYNELMSDPEVRKEYGALDPEFQLVRELIRARREAGLTQKELAEKTGIQQANLSRIESQRPAARGCRHEGRARVPDVDQPQ